MVTGRTANPGENCAECPTPTPAVSTFMVKSGHVFGSACERHIIAVHDLAEKTMNAKTYRRGSRTGRVNVTHVPVGARILVRRTEHHRYGLVLADTKTGALIATVTGKRKGGGFRCYTLTTDLGDIVAPAAMCMHTVSPV